MKFKNHKPGDKMTTTCPINGVRAGAIVELVEYRERNWDKARALTGKSSVTKIASSNRETPEHWVCKFVAGDVKKTRLRPAAKLPERTFIAFAHMVEDSVN